MYAPRAGGLRHLRGTKNSAGREDGEDTADERETAIAGRTDREV